MIKSMSQLLGLLFIIAAIIFAGWTAIWGTPNMRLFAGIGLLALYLPTIISHVISVSVEPFHGIIFSGSILLIASKFIV